MATESPLSYRSTAYACYTGNFVQAIVTNITPILFIPLREQFGLSFQQLGLLVLVNFVTQVTVDLLFSGAADRYGFRPFLVAAPVLTMAGFLLFAFSPQLFDDPYIGFLVATIVFSGAGGLLELLLSPVVNAIPTAAKATTMSILHSFYSWGQVAVVLITTLALFLAGRDQWPWIVLGWSILPLVNLFQFLTVPLAPPVQEEQRQGMRMLLFKPFVLVSVLAISLGAASEVIVSQWASAFLEDGLRLPKLMGDMAGLALFAVMMGIGRLVYGLRGAALNVHRALIWGAAGATVCYLVLALSPFAPVSLLACALCGLAVSLLWPGTLVIASAQYPLAGAWLFAILAAGGDIGAAFGPWLVGFIADRSQDVSWLHTVAVQTGLEPEQLGLRAGLLFAALFPAGTFFCQRWLRKRAK